MKLMSTYPMLSRLGVAALAISVTACGGGSSGSSVGTVPAANPNTSSASERVTFTIPAMRHATAADRTSKFISSGINGVAVTVALHSTGVTVGSSTTDVSPNSPECSKNTDGSRTCTIIIPAPPTPPGDSYDITLNAYDTAPVAALIPTSANLLATALSVGQVIVLGTSSTVGFTLEGTPAKIVFSTPRGVFSSDQGSQVANDAMSVLDAAGQVIAGTYSNPVILKVADSGNHLLVGFAPNATATDGSETNFESGMYINDSVSASLVQAKYDGQAPLGYVAAINPQSGIAGALAVATIGLSVSNNYFPGKPPVIQFDAVNQTALIEVIEGGFTGTFSETNTCAHTNYTVATINGSAGSFSIADGTGISSACTVTFSDGTYSYVPVTVGLGATSTITIPQNATSPTPSPSAVPVLPGGWNVVKNKAS